MMRPRTLLRGSLLIGGALVFLAVGAWLEREASMRTAREALQARSAHRDSFPGARTVRLLNRMGVIHAEPAPAVSDSTRLATMGHRKPEDTITFWGVGATDPRALPSSRLVPAELRQSGVPILSIYMEKRDLRILVRHKYARGRGAEHGCFISFFDGGRLVFGSAAGIRLHGGRSRQDPHNRSFRLYLRDAYGAEHFPASMITTSQIEPLRRIVLRQDTTVDNYGLEWHLVSPLAFDIARRVGALTPEIRPVILFLNGKHRGVYMLTEYLDESYVQTRFGYGSVTFVRTKRDLNTSRFKSGDLDSYENFVASVGSADRLGLEEIAAQVDLDNLTRWFLSAIICGTDDLYQGPLVYDPSDQDNRWFWINWDMDHSFMSAGKVQRERPWEIDIYDLVVGRYHKDERSRLLRALLRRHAEFRRRLLETYVEVSNHRVTPQFLADRLNHYEDLGRRLGIPDLTSIERVRHYMHKRQPLVREHMGRRLGGGAAHQVTVMAAADRPLEIDGREIEANFSGWYYETTPIELAIPDRDLPEFSHWQIGPNLRPDPRIRIAPVADTIVRAVYRERSGS